MAKRNIAWARPFEKRRRAVVALAVRAAYRAFHSVFRFVLDNISDIFCVVCTHTAFSIKKLKAPRDFQKIFQMLFASFVPPGTNDAKFI